MDVDALVRLAEVLHADARLAGEVRLAAEDPVSYQAAFRADLHLRGIRASDAGPDLPWIALVDGLIRRSRVLHLDWRDDLDAARDGFRTVRPRPPARVWPAVVREADDGSAEDVLGALARTLVGTGQVLARVEDPGDAFVVLVLPDPDLPQVVRLAEQSGYGTVTAWPTEQPEWEEVEAEPEEEPPPRTWTKYLAWLGHFGTHGFLLDVVRDPALLDPARDALRTAPARDRRLVEAVGVLLQQDPHDAVAVLSDVDVVLDAVLHLHFAVGREAQVFAIVLAALDHFGLPDQRIARTRAIVRAVRFHNTANRARPAFLTLPPDQRNRIRGIVHRQLASRDRASLTAALQAACVVGNRETLTLITELNETTGEAAHAASFLRRWPGGIA